MDFSACMLNEVDYLIFKKNGNYSNLRNARRKCLIDTTYSSFSNEFIHKMLLEM